MASGVGKNSYGVSNFGNYPIRYSDFEFGEFDQYGNPIDNNNVIRTKNFMDISNIKGEHYDIGYPLGYHGYPYVNSRICDVYFYNINKELIKRDRGILRFNMYHYNCKQSKQAGGCATYRNYERETQQLKLLQKKWGSSIVKMDTSVTGKAKKKKVRIDYNPIIHIPIKGI